MNDYFLDMFFVLNSNSVLDEEEIELALRGQTSELRAQAAEKLCHKLIVFPLDKAQRNLAKKIIDLLTSDTTTLVRQTIAVNLCTSKLLEPSVIDRLIKDDTNVAAPILQHAPEINADTAFEIILNGPEEKKYAIAMRQTLANDLIEAIAEFGELETVLCLANNPSLDLTEMAISHAVRRFSTDIDIQKSLAMQPALSIAAAETLAKACDGDILLLLTNRHSLPISMAFDYSARKNSDPIDLVEQAVNTPDPISFAEKCVLYGWADAKFLTKILCLGGLSFVEHALSHASDIPIWKIAPIIEQANVRGLQKILERAGLQPKLALNFVELTKLVKQTRAQYPDINLCKIRLIERILTGGVALTTEAKSYLLDKHQFYYRMSNAHLVTDTQTTSNFTRRNTTAEKPTNRRNASHSNPINFERAAIHHTQAL